MNAHDPLRLLLIEDCRPDAELCISELAHAGFAVDWEVVVSRQELEQALAAGAWDLALLDYGLPGWCGLDAIHLIREQNDLPIILVTGTLGDELAVECIRAGASDYVLKNNLLRLPTAARRALEAHALQRERNRVRAERDRLLLETQERMKELSCIFEVSRAIARHQSLPDLLQEVARLLPSAMQAPELARGRVSFEGEVYGAARLQYATSLSADMLVDGKIAGRVEVCYLEWPNATQIFLPEERKALQAIARATSEAIAHDRAEQDLRCREAHFRSLIEHSHDLVSILDADGTVRYQSPSVERILGHAPGELIGTNSFELVHPEDAARLRSIFQRGLEHPGPFYAAEYRMRHKDGRWRVMEGIGTNLLADPAVRGLVMNARDITRRKNAEEQLLRAHAELEHRVAERTADLARVNRELAAARTEWEQIFNCMSDAVTYHDPECRILRSNRAFRKMFPEAPAEGARCFEIFHGRSTPPDWCPMAKTLATGETASCEAFEPRLGRHLNIRTDPVKDSAGNIIRVVHTVSDISERKTNEAAQARLAAIVQATTDLVATVDPEGSIVYLNDAGRRMLGIENSLAPPRIADIYPDWVRDLATHPENGAAWTRETTLQRFDGSSVPVLMGIMVHPAAPGRRECFSIVAHDITQRKEVERMKDELVSTVSHELRTPLASMLGFSELLLEREYPAEKQREFLGIIQNESRRLSELINNFLDLQRIEAGRQAYDLVTVEVPLVMREALAVFGTTDPRHAFTAELPDDLPAATADLARLRQVLSNLLSNAVKYSPEGGAVRVGARAEGDRLLLWVADEGIGIAPEDLPRLFTRFFRGENAARCGIRGSGLGLALCREIVRNMHGEIWGESELGRGSTFYVALPAANVAAEPPGLGILAAAQ